MSRIRRGFGIDFWILNGVITVMGIAVVGSEDMEVSGMQNDTFWLALCLSERCHTYLDLHKARSRSPEKGMHVNTKHHKYLYTALVKSHTMAMAEITQLFPLPYQFEITLVAS